MTALAQTDLTTSQKVHLAAKALAQQGKYGEVSDLSHAYAVSRPTVYAAKAQANAVLSQHFAKDTTSPSPSLTITPAVLHRATVALRVVGVNSLRRIQALLPLLYSGCSLPYDTIQELLVVAGQKAKALHDKVELSRLLAGALDELFSQGEPILGGVDLASGYLFLLSHRQSRSAKDWAEVLLGAKQQGLSLEVAVKDAAQGIAAGVAQVFPKAEQRDDCFHAKYELGKVLSRLERKAYAALTAEQEAKEALLKKRAEGGDLRALAQQLRRAQERCQKCLWLHETFERAVRQAQEALEFVSLQTGLRRCAEELCAGVVAAADSMLELPHKACRKVGRYLKNRAPGLSLYLVDLNQSLDELAAKEGAGAVSLACVILRLVSDLKNHRRPWNRSSEYKQLLGTMGLLEQSLGPKKAEELLAKLEAVLAHRYRASSAIEGVNALVRPHLYVQKKVRQGFLDLFRAYYNLRTRRFGRHKGTSAHECVTGEKIADWLTHLGYPPQALVTPTR